MGRGTRVLQHCFLKLWVVNSGEIGQYWHIFAPPPPSPFESEAIYNAFFPFYCSNIDFHPNDFVLALKLRLEPTWNWPFEKNSSYEIILCYGHKFRLKRCFIPGHYSALARLINLLRRAGKLDECSKYIEQVGREFSVVYVVFLQCSSCHSSV